MFLFSQMKGSHSRRNLLLMGVALLISTLSSCSLLIGNIKPVEEKSTHYKILDLEKERKGWTRIKGSGDPNEDPNTTSTSDMAFQATKTGSIITLNSGCRNQGSPDRTQSLQDLTRQLFLGLSDVTLNEEKKITLQGAPALQTTTRGKLSHEEMMFRAIVVQKEKCVYDFVYLARPQNFDENLPDFSAFVSSFRTM